MGPVAKECSRSSSQVRSVRLSVRAETDQQVCCSRGKACPTPTSCQSRSGCTLQHIRGNTGMKRYFNTAKHIPTDLSSHSMTSPEAATSSTCLFRLEFDLRTKIADEACGCFEEPYATALAIIPRKVKYGSTNRTKLFSSPISVGTHPMRHRYKLIAADCFTFVALSTCQLFNSNNTPHYKHTTTHHVNDPCAAVHSLSIQWR